MTPHVVVAVPNDVEVDTRAQKFALGLRDLGYRVTLVGTGATASTRWIGDVPVQIVAVPTTLRASAAERAGAVPAATARWHRDWAALESLRARAAAGRLKAASASAKAPGEQAAVIADRALHRARREGDRVRRAVGVAAGRVRRRAHRTVAGRRSRWQDLLPEIHDMELAVGPVFDRLAPDVIIPDVYLLGAAVGSAERARLVGRDVAVVYDAREFVGGLASEDPRVLKGFPLLESHFIGRADAVLTVAQPIAEWLRTTHGLATSPPLVLNAPYRHLPDIPVKASVRRTIGLPDRVPLLAYVGGLNHFRGCQTIVEALPMLPGVHLVLVAKAGSHYTKELLDLAVSNGSSERLHFAPFAPPHEVTEYLSTADISVIPFLPVGNHEWAAPNKYFESVQARLPIVTSDVAVQVELTTGLGNGEVFHAEDASGLADAVRAVLAEPARYRAAYTDEVLDRLSWEGQMSTLGGTVRDVLGEARLADLQPSPPDEKAERYQAVRGQMARQRSRLQRTSVTLPARRLLIGPRNSAGQADLWAQAMRHHDPDVLVESLSVVRQGLDFPADRLVTAAQWHDPTWQAVQLRVVTGFTHVLAESGAALVGGLFGPFFDLESDFYRHRGIRQGVVLHGSDVRSPRAHAARERWSPFSDPDEELTAALQHQTDDLRERLSRFAGPVFVSTPDLLTDLPDATWLPVTVDPERCRPLCPALATDRGGPPVVVHAPSNSRLKGSERIDEMATALHDQGRITYRRVSDAGHDEVRAMVRDADVVLDQFALGSYGVAAVEALAAGRLVVGHVSEQVRSVAEGLPLIEADPDTFPDVMEDVLTDPSRYAVIAAQGPAFVARWHDGTDAARVLDAFVADGPTGDRPGDGLVVRP